MTTRRCIQLASVRILGTSAKLQQEAFSAIRFRPRHPHKHEPVPISVPVHLTAEFDTNPVARSIKYRQQFVVVQELLLRVIRLHDRHRPGAAKGLIVSERCIVGDDFLLIRSGPRAVL